MKNKHYSTKEIAKFCGVCIPTVNYRVRILGLHPEYKTERTLFFSEQSRKEIYRFNLRKEIEEIEVFKPVYIHSETLIIPSKLNFLTLDQL